MTESIIPLEHINGTDLVSTEVIADHLNNEHRATLQLLRKYQPEMEAQFGSLAFEMRVNKRADGRACPDTEFALLTEDQSFFLLALMKNNPPVVAAKANLVTSFAKARRLLQQVVMNAAAYRQLSSRGYRDMSGALKASVPEATRADYAREGDRLNRIVLGMRARDFRLLHGIPSNHGTREYCETVEHEAFAALQAMNTQLLDMAMSEDLRTLALQQHFDKHFADAVAALPENGKAPVAYTDS